MAKGLSSKVLRMANKRKQTVGDMFADLIEKHGSTTAVALTLGVVPVTVRYHLLRDGWRFDKAVGKWIRQPEAVQS